MAKKSAAKTAAQSIVAYKGFNRDLTCTPSGVKFQYEVGKTYDNGGQSVRRCGDGAFHGVEMPLDAFNYYGPATSVYHGVAMGGEIAREDGDDTKIASAEITINAEVKLPEFIRAAVRWIIGEARERVSTGYRAHAASTGDYAHAASTGYRAHAASTGDYAHAASTGNGALAAALGARSTAKAEEGGGIILAAYDESVFPAKLVAVRASLVGQNGIEAGKAYRLTVAGEFEEVK